MAELTQTVKAVGFSLLSPEVVLLVADKTAYCLHFYPSKVEGSKTLDLSSTDRPHWVLLKSPEHISAMAPYGDSIHRLVVFGRPEELVGLGLPILDATVTGTGVEVNRRSNRDELLARIDKEAVDLSLADTGKAYETLKKQERDKMERTPSGKTFFQQLKDLKAVVGKDNPKLNLVTQVGIPAVLRIMGDSSREEFVVVCKLMVTNGGVSEAAARSFYRWVEGFDGEGVELGKAVDALVYPKQDATERPRPEDEWTDELTAKLTKRFGVSEDDLLFVARSYVKLLEEKEKAKSVAKSIPTEDDGGFPTDVGVEPEAEPEEPVAEAGEEDAASDEEDDGTAEAKYPGEEGFSDTSEFGWPEEGGDDKGDDENDGMHETTGDDDADADAEGGTEEASSIFGGNDFSDFS